MPDVGQPGGQPARCRRAPDPQGTAGQAGRVRLQSPDRRQRRRRHPRPHRRTRKPHDAAQLAPAIERITRRTGRPPRAVTADRGYGVASVERDLHPSACAAWRFRAEATPARPAASSNTDEPSATKSNGEPDPKAGSTTSNAATAGTAPNSPASTVPEPGADTASSPTTSSRSAPWPHENRPPTHQPCPPSAEPSPAKPFFRS